MYGDLRPLTYPWVRDEGGRLAAETERYVAELFSGLLQVEVVSPEDDFFVLGGTSLLAMRLTERVREDFSIRIPVRRFYEGTTVAELARLIDELRA